LSEPSAYCDLAQQRYRGHSTHISSKLPITTNWSS